MNDNGWFVDSAFIITWVVLGAYWARVHRATRRARVLLQESGGA